MTEALLCLVVLGVFVRVFCIARLMDETTPTRAKIQHGIVLVLCIAALPMFWGGEWSALFIGSALWLHLAVERRQHSRCGQGRQA